LVKDKQKIKEAIFKLGEGIRKVGTIAATHPATFAIMIVAIDKVAVMVNRSVGMKKDGSWRHPTFKQNNNTLAFLSDITVNLGMAAALAPVAVQGLGVVQAAVSKRAPS